MKEVMILVGMQGSGKTHYCRTVLPDYTRVSQDEGPRNFAGVLRHLGQLLESVVEKIVIDRTNPLRRQRQQFTELARTYGYTVKIIYFDLHRTTCLQRLEQRKGHPTLSPDKTHQAIDHFQELLEIPSQEECDELLILRESPRAGR